MRGPLLLLLVLSLAGCTKKSLPPAPAAAPEQPPSSVETAASPPPVTAPVVNCDPRAISAEFASVAKVEKERAPLEAAAKKSPAPENFRALLEYDRELARLAERARLSLETCPDVPTAELKKLRATETAAAANILYLEESLAAAVR